MDKAKCGICGNPMSLLVQLYTPEDDPPEAFHRTVYVFCCKTGICHREDWKKCFKVFRSQLPQENKYYTLADEPAGTSDDEEEAAPDIILNDFKPPSLCTVCGGLGDKTCSKCHSVSYCSREHQMLHWNFGFHKKLCGLREEVDPQTYSDLKTRDDNKLASTLFPEFEVVSGPEKVLTVEEEEEEQREFFKKNMAEEGHVVEGNNEGFDTTRALVPAGDEIYENTETGVDEAFLDFQRIIDREPRQVVRYARIEYETEPTTPLWVSDRCKPSEEDIPNCTHCGEPRTFEFQILSTLLHYLSINNTSQDSIDWGTLLIYTCQRNCSGPVYTEEVLWRQDFSEDGVQLRKNV
ncbi:hypothetical protein BZG36_01335 [Bifiguratus adelaidae]|uniref:MYND-type domain-containing protein n=1 Tax=Bifiguratus adelaidae TaxID=1938954 RepID=A0A261Y583_9FUNG|nr:hypothetical protein BZG36_01335 [Bifiguratus adelaidae]